MKNRKLRRKKARVHQALKWFTQLSVFLQCFYINKSKKRQNPKFDVKNGHPLDPVPVNTDTHYPENLITDETALKIATGSGHTEAWAREALKASARKVEEI